MAGAWEIYYQWSADDRIALLSEPEGLDSKFRRLASIRHPSPKVWADAYLTAFTSAAGLRLITFDRALGRKAVGCLVLK